MLVRLDIEVGDIVVHQPLCYQKTQGMTRMIFIPDLKSL